MTRDEFETSTIDELHAIVGAWDEAEKARDRAAWERTRMLATLALQPHSRRPLRPLEVLRLPWDNEKPEAERPREMTKEERMARFERLARMRKED